MKSAIMKMNILMMAVLCCMAVSCSKIADLINMNKGDHAAVVDGKSYNLANGYWESSDNEVHLYFTNMDMTNMTSMPERVEMLTLNIDGKATSIQEGDHTGDMEFWSMSPATESYDAMAYGNVNVTISLDDSGYTVTIPEITVDSYEGGFDSAVRKVPFTFKYIGQLEYYSFE